MRIFHSFREKREAVLNFLSNGFKLDKFVALEFTQKLVHIFLGPGGIDFVSRLEAFNSCLRITLLLQLIPNEASRLVQAVILSVLQIEKDPLPLELLAHQFLRDLDPSLYHGED